MALITKNIQKTSGTRKKYKPGQLITIDNCVFRVVKTDMVYQTAGCVI